MPTLLIVDDEPVVLKVLARFLEAPGRTVHLAGSGDDALRIAEASGPIDVALVDKNLGEHSGLDVARKLKAADPHTEIVLITGYASVQSAIEAVQVRVYDYLTKPIEDFDALKLRIHNALEKVRLAREHVQVQHALAESEARYREIFTTAPDAIVAFDGADGRICEANPAALEIFRCTRAEILASPVSRLFMRNAGAPGADAAEGEVTRCRRGDDSSFPAELRHGELRSGEQLLCTYMIRDVSVREQLAEERRAVEAQLRHAQKMDAIGRLASGLGHDLGNLLAVVMSYSEALLPRAEPGIREDLEAIQGAADRAASLVRQLMMLARKGSANPTVVSVTGAVNDVLKLLRRTVGDAVRLDAELQPFVWPVRIDSGHVLQVLLNLAVNARDAMPDGGTLVIRTANATLDDREARAAGLPPGEYARLTVRDTGIGMDADVRSRIFEPFFTTKESGKGTGLGLAVTYGIVQQAGGAILVDSAPGEGTTFTIYLPRAQEADYVCESPPAVASRPAPRVPTVLVAEDEDAVRTIVARVVSELGMHVIEARNGEEALQLARNAGSSLDLLLTDMTMPGMSGRELAEAVQTTHPRTKVLVITGFPGDPAVASVVEHGGAVLAKPFQQSALVAEVRRMLAG